MNCNLTHEEKEIRAINYATTHGINGWNRKGNRMIYYTNDPKSLVTTKVTIRLDTMKKEEQKLNKWNPKGNLNLCREENVNES